MPDLNEKIRHIPLPTGMAKQPISETGFPVPWFCAWIDDKPDFRVVDSEKLKCAVVGRQCFLCGLPLGRYMCFAVGPMCTLNRVSAEPPSHQSCARYAVQACPFLTQPRMRRN